MMWEAVIIVYLMLGLALTWMFGIGRMLARGRPIKWHEWVAGTIGWLPVLVISSLINRGKK